MAWTVVFRADASSEIGFGHLVRCLSLAAAVEALGGKAAFVCRRHDGAARGRVPHRLVELPDEIDEAEDAARTCAAAPGASAIVVDHYGLGAAWWSAVAQHHRLAVIDDCTRQGLDPLADVVINQNPGIGAEDYPGVRLVLAGPHHALLRSAFPEERDEERPAAARVERILVTLGGADPNDATSLVLEALRAVKGAFEIDLVVGPGFRHAEAVATRAGRDARIRIHRDVANLAPLMARADLAVTGGGTTLYELACVGLPAVAIEIADNQAVVCRRLDEAGAVFRLGRQGELTAADVAAGVRELIADGERRASMRREAMGLVDGRGAQRVAQALREAGAIALRPAKAADAAALLAWRNDPLTRAMSLQHDLVTEDEHVSWFAHVLIDSTRRLLVGEIAGRACGQVRFDFGDGDAEVSITLAPEFRGRGLGVALLEAGVRWFRERHAGARLIATIRPHNEPSKRIFARCGFVHEGMTRIGNEHAERWSLGG